MTNPQRILSALDARLQSDVELTIYGRAALALGFENPPSEFALSRDVDIVLWSDQAEELAANSDFWSALEALNRDLEQDGLYVSHLFTEDQVTLRPDWRSHRVPVSGPWTRIDLYRLGDIDLLLSKLMRDDPVDRADALFIAERAGLRRQDVEAALRVARVPPVSEIQDEFTRAAARLLASLR